MEMSIRKKHFVKGEYYHVYNRGNAKRLIFMDDIDYHYFLKLLFICNTKSRIKIKYTKDISYHREPLVSIGAYCLMPNHFHILIKEKTEGGISKFIQKVCTGYVMYFDKKYKMSGGLYQGKFKSQHVDSDRYLRYLYSYIHLNPIKLIDKTWKENGISDKEKSLDFIKNYQFSSYKSYIENEKNPILDIAAFPDYFTDIADHFNELQFWMTFHENTQARPV